MHNAVEHKGYSATHGVLHVGVKLRECNITLHMRHAETGQRNTVPQVNSHLCFKIAGCKANGAKAALTW